MAALTSDCMCGSTISAFDAEDVPLAVQRHQQTDSHLAYTHGKPKPCIGDGQRGCLAMVHPWRARCQFCSRTIALRERVAAAA